MKTRLKIKSLLLTLILVIVTAVSLKPADMVYAASGSITITPGSKTVHTGDTFEVVVTFSCPTGIGYTNFFINYNPAILTFVSGDVDGSGYNGTIPFEWLTARDKVEEITYKLNFKAVQTGSATITAQANQCVDVEMNYFTPGISNSAITVIAPGSDDATLSSLQVGGASLIPAFAKWTMDYTCYVNNSVTSVNISATSSQGGRVEISGTTENLQLGSNYVTVTSYAPNGKTMKYNINIFRLEPPTDPPTEAPTDPPPEDIAIKIDGKNFNVSSAFDVADVPENFNVDIDTYKGQDVLVAVNEKHNLTLMYLVDEENNGDFYIHDNGVFYHYCVITIEENIYFVFDSRKADNTPEGTEKEVTVRDKSVKGFVDQKDDKFIYFYAMNGENVFSWYCYDSVEKTVQRVSNTSTEFSHAENETTTADVTTENDNNDRLSSENESLRDANNGLIKIRNIAIVSAGVLLVVLVGLIVFLLAHKSEKKHAIAAEDIDYVEIEDEIEAAQAASLEPEPEIEPEIEPESGYEIFEEISVTSEPEDMEPTDEEADNFKKEAESLTTSEDEEEFL